MAFERCATQSRPFPGPLRPVAQCRDVSGMSGRCVAPTMPRAGHNATDVADGGTDRDTYVVSFRAVRDRGQQPPRTPRSPRRHGRGRQALQRAPWAAGSSMDHVGIRRALSSSARSGEAERMRSVVRARSPKNFRKAASHDTKCGGCTLIGLIVQTAVDALSAVHRRCVTRSRRRSLRPPSRTPSADSAWVVEARVPLLIHDRARSTP